MGPGFVLVVCLTWLPALRGQDAPPRTVFYGCNDTFVSVAVKVDPLGINQRLHSASLTLGKCLVSSTTALFGYLVFEYQYRDCGFNRMDFGNATKFFVDLVYKPTNAATHEFSQPFSVPITCIVNRIQMPPALGGILSAASSGRGNLSFSYRFMNDDFTAPTEGKEFFLGSPINLELAVNVGYHMPLRLFVDEGIATPTPKIDGKKYNLITNHGCFVDGKVAHSKFVEQDRQDVVNVIWLTFPAMKFTTVGNVVYLTFKLVVGDPKDTTELRKACSYVPDTYRWDLLGFGDDAVCSCCDSVCTRGSRKKRGINEYGGLIHTMVLGPFKVHSPSAYGRRGNESTTAETGFIMPPAVGALLMELSFLMLLCIGVITYSRSKQRLRKPDESSLVNAEE